MPLNRCQPQIPDLEAFNSTSSRQESTVHQWGSSEPAGKTIKGKKLNRDQSACSAARYTHPVSHIATETHACREAARWQFPWMFIYEYATRRRRTENKDVQRPSTQQVTKRQKHGWISIFHARSRRKRKTIRVWNVCDVGRYLRHRQKKTQQHLGYVCVGKT